LKRPAAVKKDNFPKRIGPVSGPVRFVVRPALAERRSRWELESRGEAIRIHVPRSLTLDEPDTMAQASRAGIGLAYAGEWLVADDG
jgi:DNA-binding transcriptional LysR family regulator